MRVHAKLNGLYDPTASLIRIDDDNSPNLTYQAVQIIAHKNYKLFVSGRRTASYDIRNSCVLYIFLGDL